MPNLPTLTSTLTSTAAELTHRFLRILIFQILSSSPLPRHISFILDGNRRYARKLSILPEEAHRIGFLNVVRILRYCAELGIPFVSIFAFSIDNFRRTFQEIQFLKSLIREKLRALHNDISVINEAGIRIHFVGDLSLIEEDIRDLARKAEERTKGNDRLDLLVCLSYSSKYEVVKGVSGACEEKKEGGVTVADVEKGMFMARYPEPDLLVRTSGEWRMSNFFLWQSGACMLYAPACMWPEFSLRHLVYAVVKYQGGGGYLRDVRVKIWEFEKMMG
ncbi:dehydrodolichyl diphosphate synthase 6-like [Phalaenopsis equestris]|uniref:dehydrodolichyl diphosphate synthase 6-like n=1 Tax=Phalaenopsis equestris TaxID=78828 RepID=UPI0009E28BAD|nr:dehydrodolichyl diphosphate synthase 6-like [Phalaenopsis equestris]